MANDTAMTLTDTLSSLWDHLGLRAAIVSTQVPADIAGFAAAHPGRIAGLALCVPVRLDPAPFAVVADRLLLVSGSRGLSEQVTARAAERLPGARRIVLSDYDAPGWADLAAERGDEVVPALRSLPAGAATADAPTAEVTSG